MSPLAVRRYRADRLLQAEFRQLQARVIGVVRGRMGATGGGLDEADLEACYAAAWQGLHATVLDGEEIFMVQGGVADEYNRHPAARKGRAGKSARGVRRLLVAPTGATASLSQCDGRAA